MTEEQVLAIYEGLERAGVTAWIDGGFCVDALIGETTRVHADLDLAVMRDDAQRLRAWMARESFVLWPGNTEANFVWVRACERVDVHLFAYDEGHRISFGVNYPFGSLSGVGAVAGRRVRCVAAEWMFRFKTSYPPSAKDIDDVWRLAARFGFTVPETHVQPPS